MDLINRQIRVCHKKGRIVEENDNSYTVSIELGGVHGNMIAVTKEYAENHVID